MGYWAAQEQGNPLSGGSPWVFEMVPGRMLGFRPSPLSSTVLSFAAIFGDIVPVSFIFLVIIIIHILFIKLN